MQDPLHADDTGSTGAPSIDTDPIYRLLERPSWHAQAACVGMPYSVFFPMRGEAIQPAKQTCASCVVRDECSEAALAGRELHGVWGGMSERERRAIRRARNAARRAS